jgi:hypothetical protein
MRCLGVAVIALAPVASGQSVQTMQTMQTMQTRSWSFSNFGGWSSSRSASSVSWGLGDDGRMHQQVFKKATETYEDGSVQEEMRSKVECFDGLCSQRTMQAAGPASGSRMQRVLDLMGFSRSSASLRGAAPPQAAVLFAPHSTPMASAAVAVARPEPVVVALPRPLMLRGPTTQLAGRPQAEPVREVPKVPPAVEVWSIQALCALFAGTAMLTGIVSSLVKCHSQRSQAREVSVRGDLAQPLADSGAPAPTGACRTACASDKKAKCTTPAAMAREAAKTYLSSLYSETTMPTKAYLARVYAKALA